MKICVIQPAYSLDPAKLDDCFNGMIKLMDGFNEPCDLIVMPENCDIPAAVVGREAAFKAYDKYHETFMQKAVELAKRCHAITFVNCYYLSDKGYRNTTYAIDRNGNILDRYYKAHLTPKEEALNGLCLDASYATEYHEPKIIEIEGIRFAFMTCYDFYMYEAYPQIARMHPDIIIGCSHQRTDTHTALSIINRFLAYHTNAYLVRASVSLGKDSLIGGCSCVVEPDGNVLFDMKSRAGLEICEIDPHKKYYKTPGFGNSGKIPHYEYIEQGRRPWLYRNAGSGIVLFDKKMPYPRICANKSIDRVSPKNSLVAVNTAIALGADEVTFDVSKTKDGVFVLLDPKDNNLEKTYDELLNIDYGNEYFRGLKVTALNDILRKLAGRIIMNFRLDFGRINNSDIDKILSMIKLYDCEKHVYFTADLKSLEYVKSKTKRSAVSLIAGGDLTASLNEAIGINADKIEINSQNINKDFIGLAHKNNIKVNVLTNGDEPLSKNSLFKMGADCIITDDLSALQKDYE